MEDGRIWEFEQSLWTGGADNYREKISNDCLMALPAPPFLFNGEAATAAVSDTPRWSEAEFSDKRVSRPEEGLIVIAYHVDARREGREPYAAHCTSVLRRISHENWEVVQHQQTPKLVVS